MLGASALLCYYVFINLSQDPYKRCTNKRTCVGCPEIPHALYEPASRSTRANAAITILCRENDLRGIQQVVLVLLLTPHLQSLSSFEPYFNSKFKYPYIFINDAEFSDEFKTRISTMIQKYRNPSEPAKVIFSVIPRKDWDFPPWIDQDKVTKNLERSKNSWTISYGGLISYRFMIRYFSGPFFHNPDLREYDFYWRGIFRSCLFTVVQLNLALISFVS